MKAISLTQPWASLMAIGAKRNETRSWSHSHRGELCICATKEIWKHNVPDYASKALTQLWLRRSEFPGYHANIQDLYMSLPFGKAVCVLEVVTCLNAAFIPTKYMQNGALELDLGDYSPGRYFYPTTNLRALKEPVSVVGHQGIWALDAEVAAKVRAQL